MRMMGMKFFLALLHNNQHCLHLDLKNEEWYPSKFFFFDKRECLDLFEYPTILSGVCSFLYHKHQVITWQEPRGFKFKISYEYHEALKNTKPTS